MEKRFVVFIVLTMLVLTGHVFLQSMFAPPRPPEEEVNQLAADLDEQPPADVPVDGREADASGEPIDGVASSPDAPDSPPAEADRVLKSADRPAAAQRVVLGSYDGSQGPLLVVVNSRGAGLELVELVERTESGQLRYRDLENTSGYLGPLGLSAVPGRGCQVGVVAAGSPAALAELESGDDAGVAVGDVVTSISRVGSDGLGVDVFSPADLDAFLGETDPGDSVQLTVEREQDGVKQVVRLTATLGVRPLRMIQPEPLEADELAPHPASCLLGLSQVGGRQVGFEGFSGDGSPVEGVWDVKLLDGPPAGVELRFRVDGAQLQSIGASGSLDLVKRYRLGAASESGLAPYHLDLEVGIENLGDAEQTVVYTLDGPNGLPLEGWWYSYKTHPKMFYSAGARDILLNTEARPERLEGCSGIYKHATKNPDDPATALFAEGEATARRTVRWAAVDTQYFVSALLPQGENDSAEFSRAEALLLGQPKRKALARTSNVTFRLRSLEIPIPAGQSYTQSFKLFAGPKDPALVASYGLDQTIYYGWFGGVARPLSLVLHFFHQIVGNFGLAIIMLTVLVRGCMFPLSRKAAKNAAMMQELAPEMRAIAEKYKKDMEKRAKAQQELFRRHNYNPLGGCWMMFVQLPIFIGLYRCLSVDIELRQASLIPGINWCSNLAGPDQLFFWGDFGLLGLFEKTGMLGPYFNILPLFTVALFLIQQKLFTPPATDEQTRMQLQVMKFMTLFIGIMFFKVASGLCLYFIASSVWGIAERKLLPKSQLKKSPDEPAPKVERQQQVTKRAAPNGSAGKGGNKSRKRAKRR